MPFLLGGLSRDSRHVSEKSLLASIAASMAAVSLRGVAAEAGMQPGRAILADILAGLHRAWMGNGYQWDYFACTVGTNIAVLFSFSCLPGSRSGQAGAGAGRGMPARRAAARAARRAAGEEDALSVGDGDARGGVSPPRVPLDGVHLLSCEDGKSQNDSVEGGDDSRRRVEETGNLPDQGSSFHQSTRRGSSSPVFADGLAAHQANSPGL